MYLHNFNKLKDRAFIPNQTILKILGYGDNKKIKITQISCLRKKGVEIDDIVFSERGSRNDTKMSESISRTKNKIFELSFCNPWDWFFTGTINPNKQDRTDLELFHRQLTQWLRDYNKKYKLSIKFLLVPELHKDGKSWHIHGFIYGLPVEHLNQFEVGSKMGKTLADKILKGDIVYNWQAYFERFGFCDLEPVRNQEAVSKYMTKYINKELANSVTELNAHKYYHSRGLKFAETIKKGSMNWTGIEPDYIGEYASTKTFDYDEKVLQNLLNKFI